MEEHVVASDLLSAFRNSATDLLSVVPGAVDTAARMTEHADALTVAAVDAAARVSAALEDAMQGSCSGVRRPGGGLSGGAPSLGELAGALGAEAISDALRSSVESSPGMQELSYVAQSAHALAHNLVNCAPEEQHFAES